MATASHVLAYVTMLTAPPARAFAALTEAAELAEWFCDASESEPRAGGRLVLRWSRPGPMALPWEGHWVTLDPPHACSYEGGNAGYPNGYSGQVAYELEAEGDGTRLTTTHTLPGVPAYDVWAERYRDVWPRTLARLVAYLEPER